MTISEINNKVNKLANAWENFKNVNDRKLQEISQKGSSDPLLNEQLSRINGSMNEYKLRLDGIETSMARPSIGGDANNSSSDLHSKEFLEYVRKGVDGSLKNLEKKSAFSSSDSDGGYLVSPKISKHISQMMIENSPMRQLSSSETISTSSLEFIEDFEEVGAGWVEELDLRLDTSTPNLRKRKINVNEIYAQPKATQRLIDDSFVNVEKWLVSKVVDKFSNVENDAFINGDGNAKPRGILSYGDGNSHGHIQRIADSGEGRVTAEGLMCLSFELKEQFLSRASFLMNRSLLQDIRSLKDPLTGQYLWNPGLAHAAFDSLLGLPVMTCNFMPMAQKEADAVILADFKEAYRIVDRHGVRVMRDPYTEKPFVKFYVTKRVGGDVANFNAAKILKI